MALGTDCGLLILELNLPVVDGLTVLKSRRQRKTNVPVMILTARGRVEECAQCVDSGGRR
jgi:DNA-binding response OmpR family regulator